MAGRARARRSFSYSPQIEQEISQVVQLRDADRFTVHERNEMLGTTKFVGTFDTREDADSYVRREAPRRRSFATMQVWSGVPKAPKAPVGELVRGQG